TIGLVFAVPFLLFWRWGWIDRTLMRRLGITVLLAAVVASFGWIMVASGLIERPWVNAYKLTAHLSLACILYGYLLWTTFKVIYPLASVSKNLVGLRATALLATVVAAIQIVLGGIMSGAKAAIAYPTWPKMGEKWIAPVLTDGSMWRVEHLIAYESTLFQPGLVQLLHRSTAYLLTGLLLYFAYRVFRSQGDRLFKRSTILLIGLLFVQVLLGIVTLISSKGYVPVDLGVYHQLGAILLLGTLLFVDYQLWPGRRLAGVEKPVDK
ncbi:MAG: COX15/CtaA family protein, partial [Saprospiraceae bacterium]